MYASTLCIIILLLLAPRLTVAEIPVETVDNSFSRIEWSRLPAIDVPFGLTASRSVCIREEAAPAPVSDPFRNQLRTGIRLASVAPEDPTTVLAELNDPDATGWAIVNEDVYLMRDGQLAVFDAATLTEKEMITLAPVDGASSRVRRQVYRVPHGWYCDGYVYDDTGRNIRSAFYFRSARPNEADSLNRAKHNLNALKFHLRTVSGTQPLPQPLETAAAILNPGTVESTRPHLILTDPGRYRSRGNPTIPLPVGDKPIVGSVTHLRIHGADFTFTCGSASLHARLLRFDAATAGLPSPRRFLFDQPSWTLDGFESGKRPYRFQDGPGPHPVIEISAVHRQSRDDPKDRRQILEAEVRNTLQQQIGRPQSFDDLKMKIEHYRQRVTPEFQKTVGRDPAGIPVPHTVEARTSWQDQRSSFEYSVWSEWPREVLLMTVIDPRVLQTDLARRESIRRQYEQQIQQRIAEKKHRQEMRKRIAEEQRRKAEAAAHRAASEKRAVYLQEHLSRSTRTRFLAAAVLCLVSLTGIIGLAVRKPAGTETGP